LGWPGSGAWCTLTGTTRSSVEDTHSCVVQYSPVLYCRCFANTTAREGTNTVLVPIVRKELGRRGVSAALAVQYRLCHCEWHSREMVG